MELLAAQGHASAYGDATAGRAPSEHHIVQFYEDEAVLDSTIGAFLAEGLLAGETALAIATAEHRDAVYFQLASAGVDVAAATRNGQLLLLDARDLLSRLMVGGSPAVDRFNEHIAGPVGRILTSRGDTPVRAFGEMVDLLWRDGDAQAAIRLEELWNDLLDQRPLSLLCAYAIGNFHGGADTAGIDAVCRRHGRVIHVESDVRAAAERARLVDTELLMKKTRALEEEVEQRRILERALRDALAERRRAEQALRQDIAERKRVEVELRRAKDEAERANRAKTDFLAMMSHELRTPLNAIIGYEQLLSGGVTDPCSPKQLDHLSAIRRSAAHLLGLIDDVLSVARVEAGSIGYRIERVAVRDAFEAIREIVEPQADAKGLAIRMDDPAGLAVRADRDKFRQILLNLVGNALKFTPAPGTIRLSAAVDPREPMSVELCVADTGPGIPADRLEHVFERFVQLDNGSARVASSVGLGLAISRDLARGMNGSLSAENGEGQGATFTLTLPRAPAGART